MTHLLPSPPEHKGACWIRPNHIFAATLTLIHGGGVHIMPIIYGCPNQLLNRSLGPVTAKQILS